MNLRAGTSNGIVRTNGRADSLLALTKSMTDSKEQYTLGYGAAATAMMAGRTAEGHAAFLVSHLQTGMKVLDCGCGPGSVTLGLATIVAPGEAVGTDLEESQLEVGSKAAAQRGIGNARFEIADAYQLPFADESFDAVFISAVLGNCESQRGLREAYRVLKPGGVIGVKEFDHSGDLIYPLDDDLAAGLDLYNRLRRHNGHDPESGRKVLSLLEQSGFRNASMRATYETFTGSAVLTQFGGLYGALISEAFATPLQELGWATAAEMDRIAQGWRDILSGAVYALAVKDWREVSTNQMIRKIASFPVFEVVRNCRQRVRHVLTAHPDEGSRKIWRTRRCCFVREDAGVEML